MESSRLAVLCLLSSLLFCSSAKSVSSCSELLSALQRNVEEDISIEGNLICDNSQNWPSTLTIQNNRLITGDTSGASMVTLPVNATLVITKNNTLHVRDVILLLPNIEDALSVRFLQSNEGGRVYLQNVILASEMCLGSSDVATQRVLELSQSNVGNTGGEIVIQICKAFYACHRDGRFPDFLTDSFAQDDCCSHCFTGRSVDGSPASESFTDSFHKTVLAIALALLGLIFIGFAVILGLLLKRSKSLLNHRRTDTIMDDTDGLLVVPAGQEKRTYSDKERIETRELKAQSSENPDLRARTITDRNFNLSDVEIKEPLGKGSFGKVYKGHWQGTDVAVKCIVHGRDFLEAGNEPFEAYLSRHVSHPNVVQTFIIHTLPRGGNRAMSIDESVCSSFSEMAPTEAYGRNLMMSTDDVFGSMAKGAGAHDHDSLETWIVLEFCDRGSLSNAVKDGSFKIPINRGTKPNVANALLTALDIANAMMYLHNIRIVHGDLKAENVLLKSDVADPRGFVCKVSDFGLSRFLAEETHIETFTYGTITHMPPELLRGGILTPAADVYSFAVLMWELLTGFKPFEGKTHGEIVLLVVNREKRPVIPEYCPEGYAELLEDCWRQSHLERPGFPEVVDRLKDLLLEERETSEGDREWGSGGSSSYLDASLSPGNTVHYSPDHKRSIDRDVVLNDVDNFSPSPYTYRKSC